MEAPDAPLLALLAAASSVAQDLDPPPNEQDEPPLSVKITHASRAAWSALFQKHILSASRVGDTDDILFFVRVPANRDEPFFALRHDSKSLPPPESADVNWEESCYLNLIMHNISYTMEVSVRQRKWSAVDSKFISTSLKKLSKTVWAAPNHARLDGHSKAEEVELTYPYIYFRVDDYEETWREIQLTQPDQIIAVELFAQGPAGGPAPPQTRHKLFSGALSYEAIAHAVKEKSTGFSLTGPPAQHFFKLRGPRGKGTAQLCVKRQRAGSDSSSSGFGSWAMNFLRLNEQIDGPVECNITWLSVSWFSIMRDVFRGGLAQRSANSTP